MSALYHPATNGFVERAVRTFKEGVKKLKKGGIHVETKPAKFFFSYQITPQNAITDGKKTEICFRFGKARSTQRGRKRTEQQKAECDLYTVISSFKREIQCMHKIIDQG